MEFKLGDRVQYTAFTNPELHGGKGTVTRLGSQTAWVAWDNKTEDWNLYPVMRRNLTLEATPNESEDELAQLKIRIEELEALLDTEAKLVQEYQKAFVEQVRENTTLKDTIVRLVVGANE